MTDTPKDDEQLRQRVQETEDDEYEALLDHAFAPAATAVEQKLDDDAAARAAARVERLRALSSVPHPLSNEQFRDAVRQGIVEGRAQPTDVQSGPKLDQS